jgi:transcriptional regulator with XRE-family HTH domain
MSRAILVPITPSVLTWAIDQAGVDVEDVADRTGVESQEVSAWLRGEAQPTKTQFRNLTAFLKRPDAFFLLPEPPSSEGIPTAFRHPPGGVRDPTRTELEGIRRARRAQRVGKWAAERVGDDRWRSNPVPNAKDRTPKDAAKAARLWLAWSLDEQQKARSPSAVVKLIRARLEERGVLTLQLSLGKEGGRGFSLYDAEKPLVAINTAYNDEAAYTATCTSSVTLCGEPTLCVSGSPKPEPSDGASLLLPFF